MLIVIFQSGTYQFHTSYKQIHNCLVQIIIPETKFCFRFYLGR